VTSHSEAAAVKPIPGQLDVDEVLVLVVRNERHPEPAAVTRELVAPAELVEAFAATLVARPQTQRTCKRACRALARAAGSYRRPVNRPITPSAQPSPSRRRTRRLSPARSAQPRPTAETRSASGSG